MDRLATGAPALDARRVRRRVEAPGVVDFANRRPDLCIRGGRGEESKKTAR